MYLNNHNYNPAVPITEPWYTHNWLTGLWGDGGPDMHVIGQKGRIIRYDGDSWAGTDYDTPNHLSGIWGGNGSNVFIVGDGGIILHYNGKSWNQMHSAKSNALNDVWGCDSDVFAVGECGTILRYRATGDVNTDGAIDLKDAIFALQILAGLDKSSAVTLKADVNGDKRIGFEEVFHILRNLAGV